VTVVLWDIDGTLLRAGRAGAQCFRDGLASMGRAWPDAKLDFGGRTDPEIAALLLDATHPDGHTPDPDAALALLAFVEAAYAERAPELAALTSALPHVEAAIAALAATGATQTVVTGNVRSIARHKLVAAGLEQLLAVDLGAFGDDDHNDRADLVRLALRRVEADGRRWEPATCWVIGDTPRDLAAARAAGVRCALVATGTFEHDALAALDPDLVLADLHDVAVLVEVAASAGSPP
jgi:phosphoglycolate phosphatase-like HAD superfamily hydrolase